MALQDDVQDWWRGQNYLGRPSSLRLTGEAPGDQGGAQAGVLDAGAPPGGGVPAPTGTTGAAPQSTVMPGASSLSPLIRAFLAAKGIGDKGWSLAQPLLSGGAGQAAGAMLTPSGQWTTSAPEILREIQFPTGGLAGLTPADYGTAAAAEFGDVAGSAAAEAGSAAAEAGSELAGTVSSAWAGPIFSAMKSFIDFVGEGKVPFQDIIELIAPGTFGPSKEWLSFPARLSQTLRTEFDASNTLANTLVGAQGPQAIQQAIAEWRRAVGGAIPGFASDVSDPYAISGLPGAGGRMGIAHEGVGNIADFGPMTAGLQALVQAAQMGLPAQDRVSAFQSAAQRVIDTQAAARAEQEAVWQSIYGSAPEQFGLATGSA